jgi:hypothetical protein
LDATDAVLLADGSLRFAIGLAGDSCGGRASIDDPDAALLDTVIDQTKTVIADLAAVECANNADGRRGPGGPGLDLTNKSFRLLADYPLPNALAVLDPGANALLSVNERGAISVLVSDFPDQLQTRPDLQLEQRPIGAPQTALGLPPGGVQIPSQPVPSGVSLRPSDGALWVTELPGLPFVLGSARIVDVSTGSAKPYLGVLTTAIYIEHDIDDAAYVLECAGNGLPGLWALRLELAV